MWKHFSEQPVSFATLFFNSRNGYSNEKITFIHTHIHDKQLEKNSKKSNIFTTFLVQENLDKIILSKYFCSSKKSGMEWQDQRFQDGVYVECYFVIFKKALLIIEIIFLTF